jgi:hypothetical protein
MLPTGVVGVIAVGVDGRLASWAKAAVPFLARLTGHGVESAIGYPVIVKFKTALPLPHAFATVWVTVNDPGPVGVPVMFPLFVFNVKPAGRKFTLKVCGVSPFVLNESEHGTPVFKTAFV